MTDTNDEVGLGHYRPDFLHVFDRLDPIWALTSLKRLFGRVFKRPDSTIF